MTRLLAAPRCVGGLVGTRTGSLRSGVTRARRSPTLPAPGVPDGVVSLEPHPLFRAEHQP